MYIEITFTTVKEKKQFFGQIGKLLRICCFKELSLYVPVILKPRVWFQVALLVLEVLVALVGWPGTAITTAPTPRAGTAATAPGTAAPAAGTVAIAPGTAATAPPAPGAAAPAAETATGVPGTTAPAAGAATTAVPANGTAAEEAGRAAAAAAVPGTTG